MNQHEKFPPPFRLGPWLVRPDLNRVETADEPGGAVQIEPRVMKVLLCLAEKPGKVWTRLELLDEVWGEAVVGEEILTRAVSELRRVFGDSAREPRYIETIRNHGYRLIAQVEEVAPDAGPPPAAEPAEPRPEVPAAAGPAPDPEPVPAGRPARGRNWPMALVIVAILVALAVLGPGIWTGRDRGLDTPEPVAGAGAVPLTSFPGREWQPALSPDATRVAFVGREPGAAGSDLFLKQRNSESVLRLTSDPGWVAWPAWSPDGQSLAFVRGEGAGSAVCTVPSLGGAVSRLVQVDSFVDGLDWSPGGASLVYAARHPDSGEYRLFQLMLDDLSVRLLPPAAADGAGDFLPRFSPDGRRLAWLAVDQAGISHLVIRPLSGAQARRITVGLAGVQGLAWTADGRSLVYAASLGGAFSLWQVPVGAAGAPLATARQIPTPGDFAWNPTIARRTGDLAFEQVQVDQDLWRIQVHSRDPWELETAPFLQSTRWEYEARYSPDGKQVALVSARSGWPEVWVAERDGSQPRQLTRLQSVAVTNVRWSPDSKDLAFNAVVDGRNVIMLAGLNGAPPRQLTPAGRQEVCAGWSHDGKSILFSFESDRGWEIYRRTLTGSEAARVTRTGGITAQETRDGRFLYHTRPGRGGLWRVVLDGPAARGEPELVIAELAGQDRRNWLLVGDRLLWVYRSGGSTLLAELDPATGKSSFITELPRFSGSGLGAEPGGQAIVYARTGEMGGDLMLIPGLQVEKP